MYIKHFLDTAIHVIGTTMHHINTVGIHGNASANLTYNVHAIDAHGYNVVSGDNHVYPAHTAGA